MSYKHHGDKNALHCFNHMKGILKFRGVIYYSMITA